MLSFDIRSLESQAAHVEGSLAPDDPVWQDHDTRPSEPVRVDGRLSPAGPGRFYFTGRIHGVSHLPCRRCLEDVKVEVNEDVHLIFSAHGDEEADDPDVYPFDALAASLDLKPAVREAWVLAAPAFVQCREDCKGLCATCGADLNEGPCNCEAVTTDTRWDALRAIRDQLP